MDSIKLCRCCLTAGHHKDLNMPYYHLEKKEVYSHMLMKCFGIKLSADKINNMICESCITRLRASLIFKRQVIKAEKDFVEWIEKKETDTSEVKEELKEESGNESDDYFLCEAVNSTKKTRESKVPSKKRLKTNMKDLKDIDIDIDMIKMEPKPESDGSVDYFSDNVNEVQDTEVYRKISKCLTVDDNWQTKNIKKLVKRVNIKARDVANIKLKDKKKRISQKKDKKFNIIFTTRTNNDKTKHIDNLTTILQYSNATLFKNKTFLGYVCGYCDQTYQDPVDLRNHTNKDHQKERLHIKTNFHMSEYNVKLDVTDLICTLCQQNVNNLTDFKTHLVKAHQKMIHYDIKDHILQFKLKKGDVNDCALCSATYETFKMLKQHMNKHYTNYTCNKCNTPFATQRSLNSHKTTHIEGSYKCDQCDKVFSSRAKKFYHERCKHLGERNISNCQYCDQSFRSYYQRNQHLVKMHNTEAKYKCNICSKSYLIKSLLMSHIKKNHLMERNIQCTECGFKFFSTKGLKAHMVKHTGVKKFTCEICHKSYARKYTLREHMRIHNNDRRFKCDVCAVTFVQKCSLKSHLLSNHGISMAASDITST